MATIGTAHIPNNRLQQHQLNTIGADVAVKDMDRNTAPIIPVPVSAKNLATDAGIIIVDGETGRQIMYNE